MPPASIRVGVGLLLWPQAGRSCLSVGQREDGVQQSADGCTLAAEISVFSAAKHTIYSVSQKKMLWSICCIAIWRFKQCVFLCILLISMCSWNDVLFISWLICPQAQQNPVLGQLQWAALDTGQYSSTQCLFYLYIHILLKCEIITQLWDKIQQKIPQNFTATDTMSQILWIYVWKPLTARSLY